MFQLTVTNSLTLSDSATNNENHALRNSPSVYSPGSFKSIYEDNNSIFDKFNQHQLAKRRFNAWAGKRNLLAKRRFNAWAGRR